MLLVDPPPSQADIHFRVFGFPVRVHPLFWVATVIIAVGFGKDAVDLSHLLMWLGVVFVSILIHELGHATLQRYFDGRPKITLYSFGGLAICHDCDDRPRSQILILLAGPGAGFLLAGLIIAALYLSGRLVGFEWSWNPVIWKEFSTTGANYLIGALLWVNLIWGLVNLLPIFPLDGGQIMRQLLWIWDIHEGTLRSLQISVVTAGAVAVFGLLDRNLFIVLMFGFLAYNNFQAMQHRSEWR